jgi:hypothetical protein
VDKASLWDKIQICLNDAKVCNNLDNEYPNSTQFNAASLTPVQVYTCFFLSDLPFLSPLILCLDFSMKFEIELCGQQKELQLRNRSDFQNWNWSWILLFIFHEPDSGFHFLVEPELELKVFHKSQELPNTGSYHCLSRIDKLGLFFLFDGLIAVRML